MFLNRTSITLLAYALLPWLLLAVHRGLRHPRGWWWPAAGALLVAASGGGVNVAVLAWLLLAPLALLIYEPAIGAVRWSDARAFALRTAACLAVASLWWVAPVVAHVLYGRDFLPFTEPPGVIWSTTSASEVLRLMGYWTSYVGVGYAGDLRPFTSDAGVMLFHPAVLVASLLVPALVALALATARPWAYAPFFLLLLLGGALIAGAGFPDGTPLRRAALAVYFRVDAVQFLRTTYKAAPLIVVAFALLAAAAAPAVWVRARWAALPLAAVLLLSAWPLVRGEAVDSQLAWEEIPPAWTEAARDLDADLPANTRAVVLPAQLFATYDWASTVDPILPALSDRPVAARTVLAYADRRSVDLLWTADNLIQQERAVDGQLPPLLRLLGAGAVIAGADDDRARSGAIVPSGAARELARGGLGEPGSPLRPGAAGGRRGRDARTARARAAGRPLRPTCARGDRARRAGRPADARRRVRGHARRPRRLRRARPRRGRSPTPPTGPPRELRAAARSGRRPRDRRRQPPARDRVLAHAPGGGPDADRGRRVAVRRRVPRSRSRRALRRRPWPSTRASATSARTRSRVPRSSPSRGRSPRSTARRTPPGWRRRTASSRATGSRSSWTRLATCRPSSCSRSTTRAPGRPRSRSPAGASRCGPGGTACRSACGPRACCA